MSNAGVGIARVPQVLLTATSAIELSQINSSIGQCSKVTTNEYRCLLDDLAAGETVSLDITGSAKAVGTATISISVTTSSGEVDYENNTLSSTLQIQIQAQSHNLIRSGGGGGSQDLWLLLLLTLGVFRRGRSTFIKPII